MRFKSNTMLRIYQNKDDECPVMVNPKNCETISLNEDFWQNWITEDGGSDYVWRISIRTMTGEEITGYIHADEWLESIMGGKNAKEN